MKLRTIAIATVVVVAALAVNAFGVTRATRSAEAFDGGRVQPIALIAHQRLARDFQHHPLELGGGFG